MIVLASTLLALVAATGVIAWLLALRTNQRLARLRRGEATDIRLAFANIFAAAFGPALATPAEKTVQARLRRELGIAIGCLVAMGGLSFALPLSATPPPATAAASASPPTPAPTFLAYLRSNQDKSLPEHVLVRIASPTQIEVVKTVRPCTDAAYVTAAFDRAGEMAHLVGGRLARDLTQDPRAWLDLDSPARRITIRAGKPDGPPSEAHDAPPAPLRFYDLDLAEFALFGPREPQDFNFGLAMAWPEGDGPLLQVLGAASARFLYTSEDGRENHFRIAGPAFADARAGDRGGEIVTDAAHGYVIEARLGRPNHPGYANFMIKLERTASGEAGLVAWREALTAHWKDCPTPRPTPHPTSG